MTKPFNVTLYRWAGAWTVRVKIPAANALYQDVIADV